MSRYRFTSLYGGSHQTSNFTQTNFSTIINQFLQLRTDIKMYHWQTDSFAYHKISDELLDSIDSLTDKFVEAVVGAIDLKPEVIGQSTITINNLNKESFIEKLRSAHKSLKELQGVGSEIYNIRDELLGAIDKALYLMKMS